MPYIKQEQRDPLLLHLEELAKQIKTLSLQTPRSREGLMNYSVFKLIKLVYGNDTRYSDHNEIAGFLDSCKHEWQRTQTDPYEDIKKEENGDV